MYTKEMQLNRAERKKCRIENCEHKPDNEGFCFYHRKKIFGKSNKNQSKTKNKTKSKSDLSKWIKKLDSVFSVYIRLRDTDNSGIGKCISSCKQIHYLLDEMGNIMTNCDNGHFENRSIKSLRYNEVNCNAQHRHANRFREGEKNDYERGIIKKYGKDKLEELIVIKNQMVKWSVFELEVLYSEYENQVKRMLDKKIWWNNQRRIKSLYK